MLGQLQGTFPGADIVLMYGLTEAFRSSWLPPDQLSARPTSIGKAIPEVKLYVLDDQGQDCAPGVPGQLVHRGGCVAKGYWNAPEATAERFRQIDRFPGETVVSMASESVRPKLKSTRVDSIGSATPWRSASTTLKSGRTLQWSMPQRTELRSHPMHWPIIFGLGCPITWCLAGSSTWRHSLRPAMEERWIAPWPADYLWKRSPPYRPSEGHHDRT